MNSKFQYDEEISEEVLYQILCNTIYIYQLIINLSFDQEKELRMRVFWNWGKNNKQESITNNTWLWLYGLDFNTQHDITRGITTIENIRQEEKKKYFRTNKENCDLILKEEWISKFRQFENKWSISKNITIDIENILKVKLKILF